MLINKKLICSASGHVRGIVEFPGDCIENAMEAAIEGRDKLGLKVDGIGKDTSIGWKVIELSKSETPEHFHVLAKQARDLGWK